MSISFKELKAKILSKEIDTVLVSLSDMQGRLVGKRVTGKAFLDYVHKETHFCYKFIHGNSYIKTKQIIYM